MNDFEGQASDYIGIGAGRCGTTSLHVALSRHPDVTQLRRKEVHYWDNKFGRKSIQWYFQQFEHSPDCVVGEITPAYFFVPGVPERVAKYCPNVKLLVLLRNPIDTIWSSFWRLKRRKQTKAQSVLDFLDKGGNLFHQAKRRHYAAHLARWFDVFDREQFWIMQSEKLFETGDLSSLWEFLGVPARSIRFPWKERQPQREMERKTRKRLARFFKPLNEELFDLLGERYDWK